VAPGIPGGSSLITLANLQSAVRWAFSRQESRAQAHRHDQDGGCHFADGDKDSGLLDFGEIRSAYRCYDLGHAALEAPDLLPLLLAGYRERLELPYDVERQIALTALLIAARRVGRRLLPGRAPSASMTDALEGWISAVRVSSQ
jgi:hypothetical protein